MNSPCARCRYRFPGNSSGRVRCIHPSAHVIHPVLNLGVHWPFNFEPVDVQQCNGSTEGRGYTLEDALEIAGQPQGRIVEQLQESLRVLAAEVRGDLQENTITGDFERRIIDETFDPGTHGAIVGFGLVGDREPVYDGYERADADTVAVHDATMVIRWPVNRGPATTARAVLGFDARGGIVIVSKDPIRIPHGDAPTFRYVFR